MLFFLVYEDKIMGSESNLGWKGPLQPPAMGRDTFS